MNYKDTQCGAKIFRRKVIEKIIPKITMSEWAFDVDLLYSLKREGIRIREVPTIWSDKEYSKLNLRKSGIQMLASLIRLRLIYSPFKFIIKVYDKIPEKFKIHH